MKIAVFSTYSYDQEFLIRYNTGHTLSFFSVPLHEQTASLASGCDAVCIFVNDALTSTVLELLHRQGVRLIVLRCAGFNNVDIPAATAHGMPVVRVPAYSPEAVAEHTMALILTLNRKTHKAYNRIREGNFSLERMMGFNLHGRKVAVIGTGRIGKAFCRILKGFGCHIQAFDIYPDSDLVAEGILYSPLTEALSGADIVSLHCPLTDSTRHLINTETLKLFKPGSMLINTSRGGLINAADVIKALKSRHLGYLGLDVYEQESKLFFQDLSEDIIEDDLIMRLISFPNVLITSHQGFFTQEAMEQIAITTFANIDAFSTGGELINQVRISE
ncbi:2-hydroxyacid dehydrogenase [Parachryseolinea silvisoli]|uniref:2-hydroxyacid dehydrogenase n=1 Tax=Parachryseolinea silvisoli TaxID=2873601 RepID=UPI002265CAC3|nr:2-hydroxyacid dehydrogenase [Parachryseolinea silvisoli]MCD9019196.1 2-hydroxyacid dehydrogenase [Parachryseolinea silvisoli]